MKKQTKSNLQTSLQSLGIIFLIFFAMAFACGDDPNPSPPNNNGKILTERNNNGGSCSTEAEFISIFKRDRLKLLADSSVTNDFEVEVIVSSLDVAAPITYRTVYNNEVVEIYPAYPATVNWTDRKIAYGKITESDYEGALYYCYKNPEDFDKFTPQDDRFPKNACVCIGQGLKGTYPVPPIRRCPYEKGQSDKTCSAN